LSLAALSRALPTEGTAHAREKRLHLFLKNPRSDFRTVTGSPVAILLPPGKGFSPVIIDQTKSGSARAVLAVVPYAGRALRLVCYTFTYPVTDPALNSQNQLEHLFLIDIETSLPPGVIAVWIADRENPVPFCTSRVNRSNGLISSEDGRKPLSPIRDDG